VELREVIGRSIAAWGTACTRFEIQRMAPANDVTDARIIISIIIITTAITIITIIIVVIRIIIVVIIMITTITTTTSALDSTLATAVPPSR
jgi:hypothetical protein